MQNFKTLVRAIETTSQLMELARTSQTYRFAVQPNTTVYLHTMQSEVFFARHDQPQVEVIVKLGAPFAWRIATDQDEAGVYVVARRKPVVGHLAGALASAVFLLTVPLESHLILKLENVRLSLQDLTGDFEFAPLSAQIPLLKPTNR
ncbi:MAG: hypothetical protein U0670_20480 [Anaerolineae bacterium]